MPFFQLTSKTLFPSGSKLLLRCNVTSPGFLAHEGNSTIVCHDGGWSSKFPICRKTSSSKDFSGEWKAALLIAGKNCHQFAEGESAIRVDWEILQIISAFTANSTFLHADCISSQSWKWPLNDTFTSINYIFCKIINKLFTLWLRPQIEYESAINLSVKWAI